MDNQNFTVSFLVNQTAEEAFSAITNVRGWWTENTEGRSQHVNDEFEVRFGNVHYSRQKLTEIVAGKKIVWLVTDSQLDFISNKTEWTNTTISFEIEKQGQQTRIRFTHHGLMPGKECYGACSNAWNGYVNHSLRSLIATGKGEPDPRKL